MCSCSGNCNCNSTTIPRGPQGPTGAAGTAATIAVGDVTALPSGSTPTITNSGTSSAATFNFGIPAGAPGTNGINGKNSYTLTEDVFQQPSDGSTELVQVTDYSWISLNQIIFIGNVSSTSNIGGYYQVTAKTSPDLITVKKLDWTIPGVTFVPALSNVPGGSLVQSSGTIGATGATGANGNGITIIKSINNPFDPFSAPPINPLSTFSLTTTSGSQIFLAQDLCPNNGDIGRITFEVVIYRTPTSSVIIPDINIDIELGIQGFSPFPRLEPYSQTSGDQIVNKLNELQWNTGGTSREYLYIKYVVDVQRITDTTANIFVDWKASSASTKASGCYHNITTITDLDFEDPAKYFEFAVKGNNNSNVSLTSSNIRFYVESLRLPQP
jgi:hypothetical protein